MPSKADFFCRGVVLKRLKPGFQHVTVNMVLLKTPVSSKMSIAKTKNTHAGCEPGPVYVT